MSTDAANGALQSDSREATAVGNSQPSSHAPRKGRPGAPQLTKSDIDRFWSKVSTSPSDGCWLWTAAISQGGYGAFYAHGRTLIASRVALFLHTGVWDATRHACHHCDTALCVRPVHLYYGTDLENARDSNMRGARGKTDGRRRVSKRHLFGAADQMLAALKDCIGDLEHEEPDGWMSGYVSVQACRAARAAIASAEGR